MSGTFKCREKCWDSPDVEMFYMLRLRSRHKIVEIKTLIFVEKSCRDKEKISTMSRQNIANLGIFSSLSRFSQMSGFRHLDIYVEIVSRLCMSRFTIPKRICGKWWYFWVYSSHKTCFFFHLLIFWTPLTSPKSLTRPTWVIRIIKVRKSEKYFFNSRSQTIFRKNMFFPVW